MNSLNDMNMDRVEILRLELQKLRDEHRDLDDAIKALEEKVVSDRLSIQRLKKRKLLLKDKISYLQDQIMPDIIA
ncbi:MAG: YdcH family protein [Paracoccaceae bacterium]|tara:strand:- start:255 stop:479 length:225 start_codon:yes stop_codon:yes gene_type:complete